MVIPVHLCGHSAEMKKIYELKKKYKFFIIEDACHALGGSYNKYKIGSCKYSDISTFSFHPVKPITTGEGGMVTTNNNKIFKKLKLFRTHGITKDPKEFLIKKNSKDKMGNINRWYYEMQNLGYNYRLTDLQSAIGQSQLKKLKIFIKERKRIAKNYDTFLKKNKFITIPKVMKNVDHAYHLYTILIDFKKIKKTRSQVMSELESFNIGSQVLYIPIYYHPYYKRKYKFNSKSFPNSKKYYSTALSIPIFCGLKKNEQKFVIEKLNDIISLKK